MNRETIIQLLAAIACVLLIGSSLLSIFIQILAWTWVAWIFVGSIGFCVFLYSLPAARSTKRSAPEPVVYELSEDMVRELRAARSLAAKGIGQGINAPEMWELHQHIDRVLHIFERSGR